MPTASLQRTARTPQLQMFLWLVVPAVAGLIYLCTSPEGLPVLLPLGAIFAALLVFVSVRWHNQGTSVSCFEIGFVYMAVVSLYAILPLATYLVNGLGYGPESDFRLYRAQPSPMEVGIIAWHYAVHIAVVALTYLAFVGNAPSIQPRIRTLQWKTMGPALTLYVMVRLFLWIVTWKYSLSSEGYVESYLLVARLPLAIAQLFNHLNATAFTLELVLLTSMFAAFRKWRSWILLWIFVDTLSTVTAMGARTQLVLLLLSAMFLYDRFVKTIRPLQVVALGTVLVIGFLVLGLVRNGLQSHDILDGGMLSYANEFEGLFGNAFDVYELKQAGQITLSASVFWLCDFTAIIPQQIAPFTKISPAGWYGETYYTAAAELGHGFAFGSISESIAAWGWPDLVVRSGLIGLMLASVHRFCAARPGRFWPLVFYIWATVWAYQIFRNSTFFLVPLFVYQFAPAYVGVHLLTAIGTDGRKPSLAVSTPVTRSALTP